MIIHVLIHINKTYKKGISGVSSPFESFVCAELGPMAKTHMAIISDHGLKHSQIKKYILAYNSEKSFLILDLNSLT